jgi:hypothetical protein
MQFEIGISTILNLPPKGTAGFARSFVKGNNRVPFPPPNTIDNTSDIVDLLTFVDTNFITIIEEN